MKSSDTPFSGKFNFNSIITQGIYTIGNIGESENAPTNLQNVSGILIVYSTGANYLSQHLINSSGYWFRLKSTGSFGEWHKV